MRIAWLSLTIFAAACSNHPTEEEQALVSYVEKNVTLPKGAGSLQCYERHYVLLEGDEANERAGFAISGGKLLIGQYILGVDRKPGIYWATHENDLPVIFDAGCSVMEVWHVPGVKPVTALCSLDIAGNIPDVVDPPVTC